MQSVTTSTPNTSNEFYRYRVLMGAMQRLQLLHTIRLLCIPDELQRLDAIAQAWTAASERMTHLAHSEGGEPDTAAILDVPPEFQTRLNDIASDRLFQASFSGLPTSFKLVELDKLVAPQRDVNTDYVEDVRKRIPGATIEDLLEFCLAPRNVPPEMKVLQTAQNQLIATSKSLDLRFLGGFRKSLTEDDISVAHGGGQPVEAITLLLGYGATPINVFQIGKRLVLNNGFHRVVAMRSEGITHAPVAVQHIANPAIEFPDQILGLSRDYLLEQPRPVLIKDFFDDALTIELRLIPRRKTVRLSWGNEDSIIPV